MAERSLSGGQSFAAGLASGFLETLVGQKQREDEESRQERKERISLYQSLIDSPNVNTTHKEILLGDLTKLIGLKSGQAAQAKEIMARFGGIVGGTDPELIRRAGVGEPIPSQLPFDAQGTLASARGVIPATRESLPFRPSRTEAPGPSEPPRLATEVRKVVETVAPPQFSLGAIPAPPASLNFFKTPQQVLDEKIAEEAATTKARTTGQAEAVEAARVKRIENTEAKLRSLGITLSENERKALQFAGVEVSPSFFRKPITKETYQRDPESGRIDKIVTTFDPDNGEVTNQTVLKNVQTPGTLAQQVRGENASERDLQRLTKILIASGAVKEKLGSNATPEGIRALATQMAGQTLLNDADLGRQKLIQSIQHIKALIGKARKGGGGGGKRPRLTEPEKAVLGAEVQIAKTEIANTQRRLSGIKAALKIAEETGNESFLISQLGGEKSFLDRFGTSYAEDAKTLIKVLEDQLSEAQQDFNQTIANANAALEPRGPQPTSKSASKPAPKPEAAPQSAPAAPDLFKKLIEDLKTSGIKVEKN